MIKSFGKEKPDSKALIISILISEGVGLLSSIFTKNSREIYDCLNKPFFAPPGWIFLPVWIILYFLMGLAAYRIYIKGPQCDEISDALFYYKAQLIFNFMWPILFFTFSLRGVAFMNILVLLVLIIITTVKFYRIDKTSGYLMIPYLLWVSLAAVLNYSVLQLNQMK